MPFSPNGSDRSGALALHVPPELIDAIAYRVVELLGQQKPNVAEVSPYLTVDEAAEYMRCSKQAVYDRVHQGVITPRRDGRRLLFARADLDGYLGNSGSLGVRR